MSLGLGSVVKYPTYEDQMVNPDVTKLQGAVLCTQQSLDSLYIFVLSIIVICMRSSLLRLVLCPPIV